MEKEKLTKQLVELLAKQHTNLSLKKRIELTKQISTIQKRLNEIMSEKAKSIEINDDNER